MKEKVTLLLPLTYNDGSTVEKEKLKQIRNELYAFCGGYTVEGTVEGAYKMQSGKKQVDKLLKIFVVIERAEISNLKHLVQKFGSQLKQESMYFECSPSRVEFIRGSKKRS